MVGVGGGLTLGTEGGGLTLGTEVGEKALVDDGGRRAGIVVDGSGVAGLVFDGTLGTEVGVLEGAGGSWGYSGIRYRLQMGSRWPWRTMTPDGSRTVTVSLVKVTSMPNLQNTPTERSGRDISLNLWHRRASIGNCAKRIRSAATDSMTPPLAVPTGKPRMVGSWASPTYHQGKQWSEAPESKAAERKRLSRAGRGRSVAAMWAMAEGTESGAKIQVVERSAKRTRDGVGLRLGLGGRLVRECVDKCKLVIKLGGGTVVLTLQRLQ